MAAQVEAVAVATPVAQHPGALWVCLSLPLRPLLLPLLLSVVVLGEWGGRQAQGRAGVGQRMGQGSYLPRRTHRLLWSPSLWTLRRWRSSGRCPCPLALLPLLALPATPFHTLTPSLPHQHLCGVTLWKPCSGGSRHHLEPQPLPLSLPAWGSTPSSSPRHVSSACSQACLPGSCMPAVLPAPRSPPSSTTRASAPPSVWNRSRSATWQTA